MKLLWLICVLQCLVVLTLYFGDIGFDRPGRFGLAFDHFLGLMALLVFLFAAAATVVVRTKQWKFLSTQIVLLVATAIAVATN